MKSKFRSAARSGLVCAILALTNTALPARSQDAQIDQGWSKADVEWWYLVSQGSRLLPLRWLEALEQPGSDQPFLATDFVDRFRYLPEGLQLADRHRLPIGFPIDIQSDERLGNTRLRWRANQGDREPWVGMNCAACHTGRWSFQGKSVTVQGAATLADFQSFMTALNAALRETQSDANKWGRFASKVLAGEDTSANRAMLDAALQRLINWERRVETQNRTALPYGFGRLDAVGHILNKVALSTGAPQTPWPADAPVSYPFIWNAPLHDKVQWNGIAPNGPVGGRDPHPVDIGALGRNTGEVIGVFADVAIRPPPSLLFRSSARTDNLIEIEQRLGRLMSPAWPSEVLGRIDEATVERGKAIYDRQCLSCHAVTSRAEQLTTRIEARMVPLQEAGTDIWMACNAFKYEAKAGRLRGQLLFNGLGSLRETQSGEQLLKATIAGVLLNDADDIVSALARSYRGAGDRPTRSFGLNIPTMSMRGFGSTFQISQGPLKQRLERECLSETNGLLAYKARPLNGIWATAPYLHNGSVPTLYDLLLPPDQRPRSFWVGSREFDPLKVGIRTIPSSDASFLFRVDDANGVIVPGNSNRGHDYSNASLSDRERMDLIEYMKSL